ncbi:MAG TPA: hypothetical protein VGI74_09995 [Streptosporangiaceae bacterium]|jgi:hypothetical protein
MTPAALCAVPGGSGEAEVAGLSSWLHEALFKLASGSGCDWRQFVGVAS